MAFEEIERRGLVLLGCGRMGSAMLEGWLSRGLPAAAVQVQDPGLPEALQQRLAAQGVRLNAALPVAPAVVLIAVKPQALPEALPHLAPLGGGDTLFLSVAAGATIGYYQQTLGAGTPVVRAMPNTPAAIGHGITALIGNDCATPAHLSLAEALLSAVGQTVRLADESQMDAVTAVSGSGPAYVFYLIETLAAAGQAQGLPESLALRLATATVAGAGRLAEASATPPAHLRADVTSPGGTTEAALGILTDAQDGLAPLMRRAVRAAADRSGELRQ